MTKNVGILQTEVLAAERQLAEKRAELAEAEKRLRENPLREFADLIHQRTCNQNHIDGCGYHYENWEGEEKRRYLSRAAQLLNWIKAQGLIDNNAMEHDQILKSMEIFDQIWTIVKKY